MFALSLTVSFRFLRNIFDSFIHYLRVFTETREQKFKTSHLLKRIISVFLIEKLSKFIMEVKRVVKLIEKGGFSHPSLQHALDDLGF